ncbi:hypothetical protein ERJ75_001375000 [Trypanosoma vivax]|nr:hypothetical protein ERJ75_001375000 [Trypanosoma vivax]
MPALMRSWHAAPGTATAVDKDDQLWRVPWSVPLLSWCFVARVNCCVALDFAVFLCSYPCEVAAERVEGSDASRGAPTHQATCGRAKTARGRRSAAACPANEHAGATAGALTREREVPRSRIAPKGRKAQQFKRLKAEQRGNASGTLPCEPARLYNKCARGVLSRSITLTTTEPVVVRMVLSECDPRALGACAVLRS